MTTSFQRPPSKKAWLIFVRIASYFFLAYSHDFFVSVKRGTLILCWVWAWRNISVVLVMYICKKSLFHLQVYAGQYVSLRGPENVTKQGVALRMSQTPLIHTELGVTLCWWGSFEIFQNMPLIFFGKENLISRSVTGWCDVSIFGSFGTRFSHTWKSFFFVWNT